MKQNSYIKQIEQLIYNYRTIKFSSVNDLELIKGTGFDLAEYKDLVEEIKKSGIEAIRNLTEQKSFADLTIFKFSDQTGNCFIATIYDSDELWQDPELLDIFPCA